MNNNTKLKTQSGQFTSYALACGYEQRLVVGDRYCLSLHQPDPAVGPVYWLRVSDVSGRVDQIGPIRTIKSARTAMSLLKRKLKAVATV